MGSPEQRSPTTRELAAACGCSQSTVSNALRDDPRISAATRQRIQETARKMGWTPNPLAAAFMSHLRSKRPPKYQANLAYAVSHPTSPRIADLPFHQRQNFQGAQARAARLGYLLEPVWLHEPGLKPGGLGRLLQRRGIPGIVIPSLLAPDTQFASLDWSNLAAVALGHALPEYALHRAAFNYNSSVPMALHRLFELGYRRIGVIVSNAYDQKVNHGWLYPLYYEERQDWGRQWIKSCVFSGSEESDRATIRAWIETERPDVILGEYLAWHVIHELGWRIPEDVAFATFDYSPDHPEIGGIIQCHEIIGEMAIDLLTSQLMQNERGLPHHAKRLVIDGHWRDGPSVPALGVSTS